MASTQPVKLATHLTSEVATKIVHEPLFTAKSMIKNILSAGCITSMGDYTCQALEYHTATKDTIDKNIKLHMTQNPTATFEETSKLPQFQKPSFVDSLLNGNWTVDRNRLLSVAGFGFIFFGPVGGMWYPALDRIMHTKFPHMKPRTVKFIFTKAILEQIFLGPVYTFAFFPFTTFGEGGGVDDLVKKLKQDYVQTLILDETCWFILAPLLYGACPVKYQLVLASCLASVEAMVLSYIAHHSFSELPIVGPIADKLFGSQTDSTGSTRKDKEQNSV